MSTLSFPCQPRPLPKLPTISDSHLRALVTREITTPSLHELQVLDVLSDHGEAALIRQLAILAHESVRKKDIPAMERALLHIVSPYTISIVAKQYNQHHRLPNFTSNTLAMSALFYSRIGAVLYDGTEPGVPSAQRRWVKPNHRKLRVCLRQLFLGTIMELYRVEVEAVWEGAPRKVMEVGKKGKESGMGLEVIFEETDTSESEEGDVFQFDMDEGDE